MTYVKVKVHPESKKEELMQIKENYFEIWVREKPEKNQVNKRLCQIISQYFDNPDGGVIIINGHHSRIKLLKIGNN